MRVGLGIRGSNFGVWRKKKDEKQKEDMTEMRENLEVIGQSLTFNGWPLFADHMTDAKLGSFLVKRGGWGLKWTLLGKDKYWREGSSNTVRRLSLLSIGLSCYRRSRFYSW